MPDIKPGELLRRQKAAEHCRAMATHNMRNSPEYASWIRMKTRCNNPKRHNFHLYGGRGIKICERWAKFENFFADMGQRPSMAHSIERIDNNGNYEPSNCRWATAKEQANNKRNNRIVEYRGVRMTLQQAIDLSGNINEKSLVRNRLESGWDVARAIEHRPGRAA